MKNEITTGEVEIKNAKIIWVHLEKPSDMSDRFEVTMVNLDDKSVKALESIGLTVEDGKDKVDKEGNPKTSLGRYKTAKSKPYEDGRSGVVVMDSTPSEMVGRTLGTIGPDTIANVHVQSYDYNFKGKKGIGCGLQGLQVVELVERGNSGSTKFGAVKDGYKAPEAAATESVEDNVPY